MEGGDANEASFRTAILPLLEALVIDAPAKPKVGEAIPVGEPVSLSRDCGCGDSRADDSNCACLDVCGGGNALPVEFIP